MTQVFIYTEDAEIPAAHLTALRKAGVIPVRVSSFDEAKLMEVEPMISGNDLLRIAVETVNDSRIESLQKLFVHRLHNLLERDQ